MGLSIAAVKAGFEKSLSRTLSGINLENVSVSTERGDMECCDFKERRSNFFYRQSLIFQLFPFVFDSWHGATESSILNHLFCLDERSDCEAPFLNIAVSYICASNPRKHFNFGSRFLCFQTDNKKNWNYLKNPMSPEPFVSHAKATLAKRSETGLMGMRIHSPPPKDAKMYS